MAELPLEISVEELAAAIGPDKPQALRLIDCREEDEWHICHIAGAELVPLSRFPEAAPTALGTDLDQAIVVYCHHGMRSLRATHWLRHQGYHRTRSMAGGIERWADLVEPEMTRY